MILALHISWSRADNTEETGPRDSLPLTPVDTGFSGSPTFTLALSSEHRALDCKETFLDFKYFRSALQ